MSFRGTNSNIKEILVREFQSKFRNRDLPREETGDAFVSAEGMVKLVGSMLTERTVQNVPSSNGASPSDLENN